MKDELEIKRGIVQRSEYVKAKAKDLREFGYNTVTDKTVDEQITLLLKGKRQLNEGITIIGMMIMDDLVL
jgi:tRNA threonylcarbamoyladenosine modification (KEOPS) complex Cgi121 subunit